jgi:hypothetical protein
MAFNFNPLKGSYDFVSGPGFSFRFIKANFSLFIPEHQQMLVKKNITIEGTLVINGELVII